MIVVVAYIINIVDDENHFCARTRETITKYKVAYVVLLSTPTTVLLSTGVGDLAVILGINLSNTKYAAILCTVDKQFSLER